MSDTEPRRVLIMEDDAPLALMLQTVLQRQGFTADTAHDGEAGLAKLDAATYDVSVRQETPAVVILTGQGNEAVAVDLMKLGAADYIVKDSSQAFIESLPKVLNDAIEQHRAKFADKKKASTEPAAVTMCAWTGMIQSGEEWVKVEQYLEREFAVRVSHGISPEAIDKLRSTVANAPKRNHNEGEQP
jgi:ActR/RegA family two-component response regulator